MGIGLTFGFCGWLSPRTESNCVIFPRLFAVFRNPVDISSPPFPKIAPATPYIFEHSFPLSIYFSQSPSFKSSMLVKRPCRSCVLILLSGSSTCPIGFSSLSSKKLFSSISGPAYLVMFINLPVYGSYDRPFSPALKSSAAETLLIFCS